MNKYKQDVLRKQQDRDKSALIADRLMRLAKAAKELSEDMQCSFNLRISRAPEIYGYPEGTTAASLTVPPGYEYVLCNNGEEFFRYKHADIAPEEFIPGDKPKWI